MTSSPGAGSGESVVLTAECAVLVSVVATSVPIEAVVVGRMVVTAEVTWEGLLEAMVVPMPAVISGRGLQLSSDGCRRQIVSSESYIKIVSFANVLYVQTNVN